MVIDSNFLDAPELRDFLAVSTRNVAVLTDYAAMEAYKGAEPAKAIAARMEVLQHFPDQVIVLKGTAKITGLRGRKAGLTRRMIDGEQTANFAQFCADLRRARAGETATLDSINLYALAARDHMDRMVAEMDGFPQAIEDAAKVYSAEELKILRRGDGFTDLMIEKFCWMVQAMTLEFYKRHPGGLKPPAFEELPNTFFFRVALCVQLMVLRWAETGKQPPTKPEQLRNDIIDLIFVAYATFFDGFLSFDKRANALYAEAKVTLQVVVPADILG